MKRIQSVLTLLSAISLLLGVIWLDPACAAPTFTSLGQIKAEGLQVPGAMDLDDAGNLYVADTRGGLVHKFSTYGELLQSFDLDGSGRGLAVTPDGSTLYVARQQSVAIVNVATGEELGTLTGAEAGAPEFGLAGEVDLDAAGNVYVVDHEALVVKIYDASGAYLTRLGGAGKTAGLFWRIGGMMVNGAGQVVVADTSAENAMVHVFTLDSALNRVALVTYSNSSTANFGSLLYRPRGITFDGLGRNYFLDFEASQVRVTSASFGYLGKYAVAGYEVGQLNNVIDTVFDQVNGRLFVGCDTARIEILGVDGGSNPVYVNHAPTVPVPLTPVAGSEVVSVTPTLTFAAATDEDGDDLSYKVVVSDGAGIVFESDVAGTSVVVDAGLVENAAYSWTVQASDGKELSAVSAPANFVFNAVEEAPTAPVLTAPVDGEVVAGQSALTWTASEDADPNGSVVAYEIEIALDAEFSEGLIVELVNVEEGVDATSLILGDMLAYSDLLDESTYFWRVVAVDNESLASEPSAAGQFKYDTTTLSVAANMPDAKVYIGGNHAYAGQAIGVAPLELRDFAAGTYSIVVERAGFEPFVAQVSLGESDNVDVYAELAPAMAVNNLSISRNGINGRSGLAVNGDAAPFLVDFDNDGDLDMLAASQGGKITLFSNMQLAGRNRLFFDQGVDLGVSGIVPFVADWNNDGRKDLVVGQADGTIKLYLNSGLEEAPAFAGGVDLLAVPAGLDAAPAVVDYNGDGAKDLLVGNDAGQVLLFVNQGDDAAPVFADNDFGSQILKLSGSAVPFPVDWDADGDKELLVTSNGAVAVYDVVDGQLQVVAEFGDNKADFFAAFPIALDESGKQLLAGQVNGELVYVTGNSDVPVQAFSAALRDKVEELAALVAEADATLLDEVAALSTLIESGDFGLAIQQADSLAAALPAGAAQTSALELSGLLQ